MKKLQKKKSTTKFYLLLGAFTLIPFFITPVAAQMKLSYTLLPAADIISVDAPAGENAKTGMSILDFGVRLPIYEKGNKETGEFFTIENALDLRKHEFSTELPEGYDEYFPKTLYGINYSLEVAKSINPKWFLVGFFSAGIFSDFKNVDGDHIVSEGGVIAGRTYGENLKLGLGAVYSYSFGNPALIPAPLIKYKSRDKKIIIDVKVPSHAVFQYAVSEDFLAGIALRSLYSNYSLGDDEAVDQSGKSPTVVFSDLNLAIESSIRLYKPLFLNIAFGQTIKRALIINDNGGEELYDRGLENTVFASIGLSIGY